MDLYNEAINTWNREEKRMWNRKAVKAKGKTSMKANFWKAVAVALILLIVGGTASVGTGAASPGFSAGSYDMITEDITSDPAESLGDNEIEINDEDPAEDTGRNPIVFDWQGSDESEGIHFEFSSEEIEEGSEAFKAFIIVFVVVAFIAALVILVISLALTALLLNPIELGCRRFFRKNLEEPAKMANVFFAFDNNYKNCVKTMFFRTLYTFLWSLLFIIPGIIKAYEYRLIPYILSENPEMDCNEAFALSKQFMTGNKWRAFVYDLSFIGWEILSAFTCGIVGVFYVNPYKASSDAALYEAIRYGA